MSGHCKFSRYTNSSNKGLIPICTRLWVSTASPQILRLRKSLINTNEITHRLAVIDGVFQRFISQGLPLLQEVDPHHALKADRWTTPPPGRVREIGRRQRINQPLPWQQAVHLCKKTFAASHFLLVLVLCLGEGDLLHLGALSDDVEMIGFYPIRQHWWIYAAFP